MRSPTPGELLRALGLRLAFEYAEQHGGIVRAGRGRVEELITAPIGPPDLATSAQGAEAPALALGPPDLATSAQGAEAPALARGAGT